MRPTEPMTRSVHGIREELLSLIDEAWDVYRLAQPMVEEGAPLLVEPSLPVLFFGSIDQYAEAVDGARIVTAGSNPSRREFPEDEAWRRFPAATDVDPDHRNPEAVVTACNQYFDTDPLVRRPGQRGWFDAWHPVLSGLGSRYLPGEGRQALHTDLGSPLATTRGWGDLSLRSKRFLKTSGAPLWGKLLRVLEPDVVLISSAAPDIPAFLGAVSGWETVPAPFAGDLRFTWMMASEARMSLFVFGTTLQVPWGRLSNAKKADAGAAIGELWSQGPTLT